MSVFGYKFRNSIAILRSKISFPTKSFVYLPDPFTIGSHKRGEQLKNGYFLFAGHLIESPNTSIWDISFPSAEFENELHGFGWLDDLVADGSNQARNLARQWLWEWVDRYGSSNGWLPHLTGRRIIRLINHSQMILARETIKHKKLYFKLLGHQTNFLYSRYKSETTSLKRLEALTGLVYCSSILKGKKYFLKSAMRKINREALRCVDVNGSVKSRNPEELLYILTMLIWSASAAAKAKRYPLKKHQKAIEKIAPNIRSLRLGNGGMVHFHKGGRGNVRSIDQILSEIKLSNVKPQTNAMDYYRIFKNRTVLILDGGEQFMNSNSSFSALSFELSTGYEELIVNMGPGNIFGNDWNSASRKLIAHSGVSVANTSPSDKRISIIPEVICTNDLDNEIIECTHDGYSETYGVVHHRKIKMSSNGNIVSGVDTILAESNIQRKIFDQWMSKTNTMPFSAQFHIAPDVAVELNEDKTKVILKTLKGIIWIFEVLNGEISIQDSAFIEFSNLNPRAAKQIVVTSSAIDYQGCIEWILSK